MHPPPFSNFSVFTVLSSLPKGRELNTIDPPFIDPQFIDPPLSNSKLFLKRVNLDAGNLVSVIGFVTNETSSRGGLSMWRV